YGAHFFSPPSVHALPATYDWWFRFPISRGVVLGCIMLCALLVALRLRTLVAPLRANTFSDEDATLLLILGFVFLPVIMVIVTKVSGGGLMYRYTLPAILGVALVGARVTALVPTSVQAALAGVISLAIVAGPM